MRCANPQWCDGCLYLTLTTVVQDPRRQLQVSKALQPSDIEWVMTGKQIDKIGHGQYGHWPGGLTNCISAQIPDLQSHSDDSREIQGDGG